MSHTCDDQCECTCEWCDSPTTSPARFWAQMAAAVLVCAATALLVLLAGIYGTPDWSWPL